MDSVKIEILGNQKLEAMAWKLPYNIRSRVLMEAYREAAHLVRTEIMIRAPIGRTQHLIRGIEITETERAGEPSILVRPSADAWYARFVEHGTAAHKIPRKRGGPIHHPGAQARPFFEPGYEAAKDAAMEIIEERMSEAIARIWEGAE